MSNEKRLVIYFGLLYPGRGVDQLFQIANPTRHHIVIIGGAIPQARDYYREICDLANSPAWSGSCTFAGYLSERAAATAMACADAVVLPFRLGGGIWNTSIHAARLQGTFVLTTSVSETGLDAHRNVYFAEPDNIEEMREALTRYAGRRQPGSATDVPRWAGIAQRHRELYCLLPARSSAGLAAAQAPRRGGML
ncbi:glycosyltransferase family protein [Frigoriglobus tundricola]|uniref:glycosyltransferase n=1 Tax=Frigoriglobus tundricola TaxID=2774151 RepID=UPI001D06FB66|nr:glycosyltransferase [Frigoriglobus tundricola]